MAKEKCSSGTKDHVMIVQCLIESISFLLNFGMIVNCALINGKTERYAFQTIEKHLICGCWLPFTQIFMGSKACKDFIR